MKSMPLLLCCVTPMLGPQVPVLGRPKKVMTEGLVHGDRVLVLGMDDEGVRSHLLEIKDRDGSWPIEIQGSDFVQAHRVSEYTNPIYVWLEY